MSDYPDYMDIHPKDGRPMTSNVVKLNQEPEKLRCTGVGRDGEDEKCIAVYFNQKPTDDQMRFLHDCMKRWSSLT